MHFYRRSMLIDKDLLVFFFLEHADFLLMKTLDINGKRKGRCR